MSITRKVNIARWVTLLLAFVLFEIIHRLNLNGFLYLIVFALVPAFYLYAGSFRCPRCGARLFPPYRLSTPFIPSRCAQCGLDISKSPKDLESTLDSARELRPPPLAFYNGSSAFAGLRYLIAIAAAAAFLSILHYHFGYMDDLNFGKAIWLFGLISILWVAWHGIDFLVRKIFQSRE